MRFRLLFARNANHFVSHCVMSLHILHPRQLFLKTPCDKSPNFTNGTRSCFQIQPVHLYPRNESKYFQHFLKNIYYFDWRWDESAHE